MPNGDDQDIFQILSGYINPLLWFDNAGMDALQAGFDTGGGSASDVLGDEELRALSDGYFGPELGPLMYAIAKAESGGNPSAANTDGEDSHGLWQINLDAWGDHPVISTLDLDDPVQNAQAARIVLAEQGIEAWSAFTNNSYQAYLPQGVGPTIGGGDQTVGQAEDPLDFLRQMYQLQSEFAPGNVPAAFSTQDLRDLGFTDSDLLQQAFLNQFGIGPGSQQQTNATNAESNRMNAITAAASQRAQQAYQQGQLAVQNGQLDLAREQFASSEYWTGVANDLSQRQFDLEAAATPANIATQMFGAQESALQGRGALELGSANTYSGLASLLGGMAESQANLGVSLLTNPRNATAAFLLGQGADPDTAAQFQQFNVERLLGIDPAQIQEMVGLASQAAGAAQQRASQPQEINLQTFLDALSETARNVSSQYGKEPAAEPQARTTDRPSRGPTTEAQRAANAERAKQAARDTIAGRTPNFTRPQQGTTTVRPSNPVVNQAFNRSPDAVTRGPFVQFNQSPEAYTRGPFVQQPSTYDILVQGLTQNPNIRRGLFNNDDELYAGRGG